VSSTVTTETPACEDEEVFSTSSTPVTACSMGLLICFCTCSEEAPGEVVITWICGSETEGISSWRMVVIAKIPMIETAMQTRAMNGRLFRLSLARRFMSLLGRRAGTVERGGRTRPTRDGHPRAFDHRSDIQSISRRSEHGV
jgi:hypothetical protein